MNTESDFLTGAVRDANILFSFFIDSLLEEERESKIKEINEVLNVLVVNQETVGTASRCSTTTKPEFMHLFEKAIDNSKVADYYNEFASNKTKAVLSNIVTDTVVEIKEGGIIKPYLVQYLGMVVIKKPGEKVMPLRDASKEFMKIVNFLVEKELIFYGYLTPFMAMDLAKLSMVDRKMLLFYVVSKVSREELNTAVEKEFEIKTVANLEAALPEWEYVSGSREERV